MTDELDEWKTEDAAQSGLGSEEVHDGEQGERHPHHEADHHLLSR